MKNLVNLSIEPRYYSAPERNLGIDNVLSKLS